VVVELPGCGNDAVARRTRDFAISTQGTAGRRDGGAGTLSYILKGSKSTHGSGIFNNITKFAGPDARRAQTFSFGGDSQSMLPETAAERFS